MFVIIIFWKGSLCDDFKIVNHFLFLFYQMFCFKCYSLHQVITGKLHSYTCFSLFCPFKLHFNVRNLSLILKKERNYCKCIRIVNDWLEWQIFLFAQALSFTPSLFNRSSDSNHVHILIRFFLLCVCMCFKFKYFVHWFFVSLCIKFAKSIMINLVYLWYIDWCRSRFFYHSTQFGTLMIRYLPAAWKWS